MVTREELRQDSRARGVGKKNLEMRGTRKGHLIVGPQLAS
jgi:hypothetical protein